MQGKRKTSTVAIWWHRSRYFGWARDDESQIYWQFGRDRTHPPLQERFSTFSLSIPEYRPEHELIPSFLRLTSYAYDTSGTACFNLSSTFSGSSMGTSASSKPSSPGSHIERISPPNS